MATADEVKRAHALAKREGFIEGQQYSPFDLTEKFPGSSAVNHRGHGLTVYTGINNGALEFRCGNCGDPIWVLPG